MKVAIFSALYPPDVVGGAEVACKEYVRLLCRLGFDVAVYACARDQCSEFEGRLETGEWLVRKYVPKVYSTHERGPRHPMIKGLWHLQDNYSSAPVRVFRDEVSSFGPDVIHIHSIQGMGYRMLDFFKELNVPVVFTLHDYGMADFKMTLFRGCEPVQKLGIVNKFLNRNKWKAISRLCCVKFVSPSQALLDVLSHHVPINRYESFVVKNPIEFALSDPVRSVDGTTVKIGFIGRLHETKGIDFALRLVQELSASCGNGFSFEIAGDGPMREAVLRSEEDCENVKYLGFLGQSEVTEFLHGIDLLIAPSVWLENSPVVVQQACSYGKPVFASRRGGLVEFVEDGKNGYLLPPTDFSLWLNRLNDYISEPSLRSSMANYAQKFSSRFHAQALLSKVISLYD